MKFPTPTLMRPAGIGAIPELPGARSLHRTALHLEVIRPLIGVR